MTLRSLCLGLALAWALLFLVAAIVFNVLVSKCVENTAKAGDSAPGECDLIQLSNIIDPPK